MDSVPASATRRPHYAWPILIVGTLIVFGALGLARFGYSVVLPSMQANLELIGWLSLLSGLIWGAAATLMLRPASTLQKTVVAT